MPDDVEIYDVERTVIEDYTARLIEPSRPPSRGGNTRANHSHRITIDSLSYSWIALGSKRWVYRTDTVAFTWRWDETKKYRNIDPSSIKVWDKDGAPIERGERGTKKLRTAATRMPGRRNE